MTGAPGIIRLGGQTWGILRLNLFLEHNKVQIITQRRAEAVVAVGKGLRLGRERVAATLIPRNERLADIDHRHADRMSSERLREVFRSGQQRSTEVLVLESWADREQAEIPDAIVCWIEPDRPEQGFVSRIAMEKKVRVGPGSESLPEEGLVKALALDDA